MRGVSKATADRMVEQVTDGQWDGCHIKDMPWVKKNTPNGKRDIDKMLKVFGRRVRKNGRLKEYQERQEFTKASKKRRDARKQAEHKRTENNHNNE